MHCPKCNAVINVKQKFCPYYGAELNSNSNTVITEILIQKSKKKYLLN